MQSGSGAGGFGDVGKEPAAITGSACDHAPDCLERLPSCLTTG